MIPHHAFFGEQLPIQVCIVEIKPADAGLGARTHTLELDVNAF